MAKAKKALVLSGGGARGAYQAGVYKYLEEIQWSPDVVCGTSVGAINASAIGAGMTSEELIALWLQLEPKRIMRYSIWNLIRGFFRKRFYPLVETYPLKKLILETLDFSKLNQSDKEIVISAVNVLSSELHFFENPNLQIEHIMASAAIPILFPWQWIDGQPYWDGGVMANTPILPALTKNATDIIVVLLSPVGGASILEAPKSKDEALERLFELYLLGSYRSIEKGFEYRKKIINSLSPIESFLLSFRTKFHEANIRIIAPNTMLGFGSILRFEKTQAKELVNRGYSDAKAAISL